MKRLVILGNGTDWCEKSLAQFQIYENVGVLNYRFPINGALKTKIARVHFSEKINKHFQLPLKNLWYGSFLQVLDLKEQKSEQVCLLIYDHNKLGGEHSFLEYTRKINPNIKICYIFTNIIRYSAAESKGYVDKLNEWYDAVFAFDPEDAVKYGFSYSPLIYDAEPDYNKCEKESEENLVFYVGQAKDRLEMLLSCHEKIRQLGIACDFHIANVPEDKITDAPGIVFNQFMTYENAVQSIQKSTCLLDAIQGNSTGLTIKVCEAVCYNKKLITTNQHVKDYPFYDPRYIRVIESTDDIDEAFFTENRDVQYPESGRAYFSADGFWTRLWETLDKNKSDEV